MRFITRIAAASLLVSAAALPAFAQSTAPSGSTATTTTTTQPGGASVSAQPSGSAQPTGSATPDSSAAPATPAAPAPAAAPAAPPAADAALPDVSAQAAPTSDENPYGLGALWKNGDAVARGTLVILVIMSIATWYIMITKFFQQARMFASARTANNEFWTAPSVADGAQRMKKSSVFGYIARNGVSAADHHEGTLTEQIDRSSWVMMTLDRAVNAVNSRMQNGLAVLATVGSTAPFVGLFGTVWGIYHALTAIGIAGQASIDKVAGPVGEALIMTAIGLATAVPAVLGYNFLVRRNKAVMEKVRGFSSDLYAVLMSGRRVGTTPAAGVPAAMPVTSIAA